jgi:hypothetical protein
MKKMGNKPIGTSVSVRVVGGNPVADEITPVRPHISPEQRYAVKPPFSLYVVQNGTRQTHMERSDMKSLPVRTLFDHDEN